MPLFRVETRYFTSVVFGTGGIVDDSNTTIDKDNTNNNNNYNTPVGAVKTSTTTIV